MRTVCSRPIGWLVLTLISSGCANTPDTADGDPDGATVSANIEQVATPTSTDSTAAQVTFPPADAHSRSSLTYEIIAAPNNTFGYDIKSDGRLLIHQTNLPGQPGNDGCRTRAEAEKLAAFVMEKIKNGEMPPTVNPEELKKLGIIP